MKFIQSHFWYNKRQRNGILFLFLFLFFIQFVLYFFSFSDDEFINQEQFALLEAKIDSLQKENSIRSKPKTYRFNPNYLSDFKAYQIGLSVEEADRLFAFRAKGNFINSSVDFQKVTEVSDSLLDLISPLFKFPSWLNKKKPKPIYHDKVRIIARDLNKASIEQLDSIDGVNTKLAKRIISYKNLLKAYSMNEQLYEVYYLDRETANRILRYYQVIDTPEIDKLDLNTATFKQFLQVPYIDYELTKKLIAYRDKNVLFQDLEELKKIDSFPLEKFDRIALYLTAE